MVTDDWYPTLTQANVELITDRIEAVTPGGVRVGGVERPADVLVLATGFKTHGFVAPMEVSAPAAVAWPRRGTAFRAPISGSAFLPFPTCSSSMGRTPTAARAR